MFEFISKEEKILKSLLKPVYILNNQNEILFNQSVDSFISDSFVGSQKDHISDITDSERVFLIQIKNPNLNVWYRVYMDKNWNFPSYDDLQKNGGAFLVKKFDVNPSAIPEENINTNLKIKPISFIGKKDLPSIYDIPDIGNEGTDKFDKNYEKFSPLMDLMVPKRLESPFVTSFGGYPQWQQTNDIPEGFSLENFIFQVILEGQEERLEMNGMGDGGVYVFDSGEEIGLVYQR